MQLGGRTPYGREQTDALVKLVLIGASNSGKTSLLLRFVDEAFTEGYQNTIGVDFKMKTVAIDGKVAKIQVWDTAGQERFRSISQSYYRNAHGCIAVYDLTSRESFEAVADQVGSFINYSPTNTARNILLVANKLDLADEKRQVTIEEAEQLARRMGLAGAIEISAKEGSDHLDDTFFITAVNALDARESERPSMVRPEGAGHRRGRLSSDLAN